MRKSLIIGNISSLLTGGLIYVFFRESSLKMFKWFEELGLCNLIDGLRKIAFPFSNEIPEWILFSLPDGLWVFSYICFILLVWINTISNKKLLWLSLVPLLAIGSEIGQLFNVVPGTFDFMDLFFYLLGAILPLIIFKKSINLNHIRI